MGEKILVGPMTKGLRNDVTPFNIDNDSFPTLINAYQWRGRVKRKRGTAPLCRLYRTISSSSIKTDGSGNYSGNILTGLETNASVVFNSISVGTETFTDPAGDGVLVGSSGATGTIDKYYVGNVTITGAAHNTNVQFNYYPTLPVLGLEELLLNPTDNLGMIAFDTTYSYNVDTNGPPFSVSDVSYYDIPSGTPSGDYPDYVAKSLPTPLKWNGQDYQQFWTANYQGALWACNGINIPFNTTNIGMQFKPIIAVTVVAGGPPAKATLQITGHGLIKGDFVFVNEVVTTTGINFQTGYVITVTDVDNVIVEFPAATIATNGTGGIAQYLTSSADKTIDCIRYYIGNPIATTVPLTFNDDAGWVNFMPPLSNLSFSIGDLPAEQYYLVGAAMILPFKDRLIAIGPVVQSSTGSPIYLQDTVVYSQNGTPYYTVSFTGAISATTTYQSYLIPSNQTATANSWWEDQTGLGGYITAGFASPINTASPNEDVIIMGFGDRQARFAYTGNDILPFQFFVINSELGSGSTFSVVNLDRGVLTMGGRGIIQTSQIESKRIDLDIPDEIFQIDLLNQGAERICAQRDFQNEWIYFTYPGNNVDQDSTPPVYPTQTLQYNYREGTWGIFHETYTTYGRFRPSSGLIWAKVGDDFPRWDAWNQPWNSGQTTVLQPVVVGGNTQGFVVIRGEGTNEVSSLEIQSISQALNEGYLNITITSPNHCLSSGDFIVINGCLGTIGPIVNGKVFQIETVANNTFVIATKQTSTSYTYLGIGTIIRLYVPFIASKAFPTSWGFARKTRLGPQQYLLTETPSGQVTLYIFLSQDYANLPGENAYNFGPVIPAADSQNNALIYSAILYTCVESTNLGLTPANTNLQMIANPSTGTTRQQQIWHRMNTSLIGDTVQVAITLSDDQMLDPTLNNQTGEIEMHAMILDVNPSSVLA